MKQLSLRLRTLIITFAALCVFIPTTVYTLERAFTQSLTEAKLLELRLMSLALVSAFELDGNIPFMPELLYDDQLNLPDSGYVGMVVYRGKVIWQSASALNYDILTPPAAPSLGEEVFSESVTPRFDKTHRYFFYGYTAEFAGDSGFEPVHFFILNDKHVFETERKRFLDEAWKYMLVLAIGLLCLLLVGIEIVLKPVRTLIRDIKRTASGTQSSLEQAYPEEFDALKNSINQLIETEEKQRERYKNTLSDLAHSIKTPLAVAMSNSQIDSDAQQALAQINNIVKRQLKRATSVGTTWKNAIPIRPVIMKLLGAMEKVYRDRELKYLCDCDESSAFLGDETDLTEMLGNLIDNACKATRSTVSVKVLNEQHKLIISINDDGPGIDASMREQLLIRGQRVDTYNEGQGIGLAIVSDLVENYQGHLEISSGQDGGAKITLTFPKQGK